MSTVTFVRPVALSVDPVTFFLRSYIIVIVVNKIYSFKITPIVCRDVFFFFFRDAISFHAD